MTDPGTPNAAFEIVLDLSRLLSRILHPTPTGVDRCEMAYARGLLAAVPKRLNFAAVHPIGRYGRLNKAAVLRFLNSTEERWSHRGFLSRWDKRRFVLAHLAALMPKAIPPRSTIPRVYLQASPNNLVRADKVTAILQRERARFVCLVHDLIPIQYPEYARPGGDTIHGHRVNTIVTLADGILANSQATLDALTPYLERADRNPVTAVAHLGTELDGSFDNFVPDHPYFVCIGTIEPRKNHLLLLHLWRTMSERHGAATIPRLVIIGRRGWENEQVVDMLERCPALKGCVEEHNGLPDRTVRRLLAHSQGLLMPSFAEGYGMPVSEAIMLGVPVVCSDLPALREAGQSIPLFLDPLDGPSWLRAIEDLAGRSTDGRSFSTLEGFPSWSRHIDIMLDVVARSA